VQPSLLVASNGVRPQWMREATRRENRVVDESTGRSTTVVMALCAAETGPRPT
jgi:uncharacterized membrane protein